MGVLVSPAVMVVRRAGSVPVAPAVPGWPVAPAVSGGWAACSVALAAMAAPEV
jgi:hypothetical protein